MSYVVTRRPFARAVTQAHPNPLGQSTHLGAPNAVPHRQQRPVVLTWLVTQRHQAQYAFCVLRGHSFSIAITIRVESAPQRSNQDADGKPEARRFSST